MRHCNKITCLDCPSHCGGQSAFKLHNYSRKDKMALSNDKNHLVFVLYGSVSVSSVDVGELTCNQDESFLLLRHQNYTIDILEDCELLSLNFTQPYQICDKTNINDIMAFLGDYQYTLHSLKIKDVTRDIARSMVRYLKDGVDCVYLDQAIQLEMLVAYRLYYSERQMLEFFYPLIEPTMYFQSLIKANYQKAKSVQELANLCGYGLHSFNKLFKEIMKMSPYQWMLQQNRSKILTLLLNTSTPLKAIASELGFTSQSHLNRYCNRFLGGTSAQIRGGKKSVKVQ